MSGMASTIASSMQQMSLSFGLAAGSLVTGWFLGGLPQNDQLAVTSALHYAFVTLGVLTLLSSLSFGPRTTGVSDQVDLTAGGDLQPSSKLVLTADVTAGDPQVLHYFRVVTLDRFTGSGWLLSQPSRPVN